MMINDEKIGSLAHTLFIQGCLRSFSCPRIINTLDTTHLHAHLWPMGSDQIKFRNFGVGFELICPTKRQTVPP